MNTGETVTVTVTAYLDSSFGGGPMLLRLHGGPSGMESIALDRLDQVCRAGGGWVACAGVAPKLDRLWVSPEELQRVRKELGV